MSGLVFLIVAMVPLGFVAWWLSPWSIIETEDRTSKTLFRAYYARQVQNGNNPLSRRVHEGGGGRFSALVVSVPGLAMAAVAALSLPLFEMEGSLIPAWLCAAIFGWVLAVCAMVATWNLTGPWVDVAEHCAEAMHGDAAMAEGALHPEALAWLGSRNLRFYSLGEAHRMTRRGQDYDHLKPDQFFDLMLSRAWAARVILWLARYDAPKPAAFPTFPTPDSKE